MSTVVGNPVIFELPLVENGVALTGKAAVLNALTNNGFTYCRHKTPAGVYSSITVGDWAEDGTTGVYRCALTATGVEGKYSGLVSYVESGHVTQVWFGEEEVVTAAQADPAAYIAAGDITMVSPVLAGGAVTLQQGDDYANADSRALEWSTSDAGTWPTLTGATIAFVAVMQGRSTEMLSVAGSVVQATGATKQVRVELTDTQTSGLEGGDYDYQVIATLASGNVVTLTRGSMAITKRIVAT